MSEPSVSQPVILPSIADVGLTERLEAVTRLARRLFKVPMTALSLMSHGSLRIVSCEGLPARAIGTETAFDAETLKHGGPLLVTDTQHDLRFRDHPWVTGNQRVRFYAGTLVLAPDGRPAGVLSVYDREPDALSEGDFILLRDLARLAESEVRAALLSKAKAAVVAETERLRQKALVDTHTHLWNRHAMFDLLDREYYRARREGDAVAAMLLEVDGVQGLVAKYGNEEVETVLAEIARRLRDALRRSDLISRFAHDQVLTFLGRCNLMNAEKLGERARHVVQKVPIYVAGDSVPVTATVAVVATEQGADWSTDRLINAVDDLVAEARGLGGNTVLSRLLATVPA